MPAKDTKAADRKQGEPGFAPFADDVGVQTFGGLTLENGTERVALHGSLDLTRDRAGLARAKALQMTLTAIVAALEAGDLPETVAETTRPAQSVPNPFA